MESKEAGNGTLVAAMSAVMGELSTLAWDSKNEHQNYRYASIDAFLSALRPKMAAHGLVIAQDLDSTEVTDGLLRMHWRFTVHHASGEVLGPLRMETAATAKMGPQAYGGAQAYALKFMLRSLFLVACDEASESIDQRKDGDLPERKAPKQQQRKASTDVTADLPSALRVTTDEANGIREWLDATASDEAAFLAAFGKSKHFPGPAVSKIEDLTPQQYEAAILAFEVKAKKGAAA